ncbi:hypothetical protein BASA83_010454 [Batrachochytrium salamandrivorans]|nr:hypothetical protein BASA83_010454 [Batrachochytrium salamandrivorans]
MTKKTPINAICSGTDNDVFTLNVQGRLVRSQRWFWSRRTKQLYRNRYWLTSQVTDHRIQSGLIPAIQKSRLRLLGRSTRSGCGECIYLAPRWSLKWQSRSGPAVGWMGTVEHESMGTKHDNRALAATVS